MLGQHWLATVRTLPAEDVRHILTTVLLASIGVAAAGLLALGGQCWRAGALVRRMQRFPAPGATVIRDTLVLEGAAAVVRGKWQQIVGAGLMLSALGLVVVYWVLLVKLGIWPS